MTYDLYIGDRSFSSWSLRGWLLLECFDLPFRTHLVGLYDGTLADGLAGLEPACTVPVLQTPEGHILSDSLAIAETLAERHPDAGLWPADPAARALARSMVAEMHSGYAALRAECPMMLQHAWADFTPSAAVNSDVTRIEMLWRLARERHACQGSWLFGEYSAADAFFAPVAARFATYGLAQSDGARAYVAAHLAQPAFRRWRALGALKTYDPFPHPQNLNATDWPGPASRRAKIIKNGPSENSACPYSGKPVQYYIAVDGRTFGVCNADCQRKTAFDPEAWPAFMALLESR